MSLNLRILEQGGLKEILEDLFQNLFPHAAKMMNISETELKGRIGNSPILSYEANINAECQPTSQKNYLIVVHLPLIIFLFQIAKTWASLFKVTKSGDEAAIELETFSEALLKNTARHTGSLMKAFWEENLPKYQPFALSDLTYDQVFIAGRLCAYSETFILAHEFAHLILDSGVVSIPDGVNLERRDKSSKTTNLIRILSSAGLRSPEVVTWQERDFLKHWSLELAADYLGLKLALATQDEGAERIFVFLAIETALVMFSMLEDYYKKLHGLPYPLTTHPPYFLRLHLIRTAVKKKSPPWLFWWGRDLEAFGQKIMAEL